VITTLLREIDPPCIARGAEATEHGVIVSRVQAVRSHGRATPYLVTGTMNSRGVSISRRNASGRSDGSSFANSAVVFSYNQ
jgi:hypothetical protein